MRLSTSTCIYFNRPDGKKARIEDSILACAKAGYKVLDMNFHDCSVFKTPFWNDDWESWVHSLAQEGHELGIEFSQSHAHFYNYCDASLSDRERLEEMVRRSIIGSGILGVKWIVIHAATDWESATPTASSKRKALEYFKPICELAAKHHVGVAIENLWEMNIAPKRRYTAFAEELVDLVDSLPFDNVGICWDFEHGAIMQQDPLKALSLIGDRLKATHVSDYIDKVHDHVLPYCGLTDWDVQLRALASINYQGDFTYETHRYTMRLPDELVAAALTYSVQVGNQLIHRYEQLKKEHTQCAKI